MSNLLRRLCKLESRMTDRSALAPRSDRNIRRRSSIGFFPNGTRIISAACRSRSSMPSSRRQAHGAEAMRAVVRCLRRQEQTRGLKVFPVQGRGGLLAGPIATDNEY
jgi:hypothetical protein